MKTFWKDYWKLLKDSARFCRKHWLGVIALNMFSVALTLIRFNQDEIVQLFKKKFKCLKKES